MGFQRSSYKKMLIETLLVMATVVGFNINDHLQFCGRDNKYHGMSRANNWSLHKMIGTGHNILSSMQGSMYHVPGLSICWMTAAI